jgi:hypothetical protein
VFAAFRPVIRFQTIKTLRQATVERRSANLTAKCPDDWVSRSKKGINKSGRDLPSEFGVRLDWRVHCLSRRHWKQQQSLYSIASERKPRARGGLRGQHRRKPSGACLRPGDEVRLRRGSRDLFFRLIARSLVDCTGQQYCEHARSPIDSGRKRYHAHEYAGLSAFRPRKESAREHEQRHDWLCNPRRHRPSDYAVHRLAVTRLPRGNRAANHWSRPLCLMTPRRRSACLTRNLNRTWSGPNQCPNPRKTESCLESESRTAVLSVARS